MLVEAAYRNIRRFLEAKGFYIRRGALPCGVEYLRDR
jgi:hypothetical protein